ncbi:MAG: helix-turn-helix domain-containing protein [Lachnospiraceae bacterium]|nr:helix-turn-helix domain-containing protein [Lachnospiraceae bacterium]
MKNSLYERIHDLRERSGMTQTDLAMRMGVTRSGVNAWEMGISKPSLDNLILLSKIFHTTTDYLLGNENEDIIVINNFTMEEKELVTKLVRYIESTRNVDMKEKSNLTQ